MSDAPLFEARDVSKAFGGLKALSNVSVVMHRHELLGMIGPNGSGKSTFVNVVTGAFAADQGDIRLEGKNIAGLRQPEVARAGIARTFQAVRVFDALSVRRNLFAGVMGHGVSDADAEQRMAAALERVGLRVDGARLAGTLGLYERRRLELATRLMSKPRVIMLDEPAGGLNPEEIRAMLGLIESLRSDVNIFIIEHTMKVITSLADRVVVLVNGQKLIDDTPQVVLRDRAVIETYLGLGDA